MISRILSLSKRKEEILQESDHNAYSEGRKTRRLDQKTEIHNTIAIHHTKRMIYSEYVETNGGVWSTTIDRD